MTPLTPLEAAGVYIEAGFKPVPINYGEKKPTLPDWQNLDITRDNVAQYFGSNPQNVGVSLGHNNMADVDCDSPEAVKAAALLLPHTDMAFGRESKPASHYFYHLFDAPAMTKRYRDPVTGKTIVELRCLTRAGGYGIQTVVPPSTHPSGETLRFEPGRGGLPSPCGRGNLERCVAEVASAALLAAHWPGAGQGRHESEMALAGVLARNGWEMKRAHEFVLAVYKSTGNPDRSAFGRVGQAVQDTYRQLNEHGNITAWPVLIEHVSKPVADEIEEWLGLRVSRQTAGAGKRLSAPAGDDLPELVSFNGADVYVRELPERRFLIDELLPIPQCVLLAGKPKVGKSWWALQMAMAVSGSTRCLDAFDVPAAARVAYFALEEHIDRTTDRMRKVDASGLSQRFGNIELIYNDAIRPLMRGGADQIERFIMRGAEEGRPYSMVVIDTHAAAVQSREGGDVFKQDYEEVNVFTQLANRHKVCVILVIHAVKGKRDNATDSVMGTNGVPAACDSIWLLDCEEGATEGKLVTKGRDVKSQRFIITMRQGSDGEEFGWSARVESSNHRTEAEENVIVILNDLAPLSISSLAAKLKKDYANTRRLLQKMMKKTLVQQNTDKCWVLAPSIRPTSDGD